MKHFIYISIFCFLVSCTSNTMYKKPKNLIPKDTMISFLTDMYIASSAKNYKNKFLKREKTYIPYVYEKYRIDTTRFDVSNAYYTSRIEDYTEILNKVKSNIDSLQKIYTEKIQTKDSIQMNKKIEVDKELLFEKLEEKNSKILKEPKLNLKKLR